MKISSVIIAALCLLGIPLNVVAGQIMQRPAVEYSGSIVSTANGEKREGRVYITPLKQRIEAKTSEVLTVGIKRLDKKLAWMLLPANKTYADVDFYILQMGALDLYTCDTKLEVLGSESINGVPATESAIQSSCPNESGFKGKVWLTKDGIVMRTDGVASTPEGQGQYEFELNNLQIGIQKPALFEVPADYKKVDMVEMLQSMLAIIMLSEKNGKPGK